MALTFCSIGDRVLFFFHPFVLFFPLLLLLLLPFRFSFPSNCHTRFGIRGDQFPPSLGCNRRWTTAAALFQTFSTLLVKKCRCYAVVTTGKLSSNIVSRFRGEAAAIFCHFTLSQGPFLAKHREITMSTFPTTVTNFSFSVLCLFVERKNTRNPAY